MRYPLSLRQVEDLLFERGVDISHETIRFWWNRFGPMFAAELRKRCRRQGHYSLWRWHLDEVFVRINGQQHYLWRAVDHEGEVLEVYTSKTRNRKAALRFLRRALKRYGSPHEVITDQLRSYGSVLTLGMQDRQRCEQWLNNRAENSRQPFRRRERAMGRFRSHKTLKKFASVHASLHNHFNRERHLISSKTYKKKRAAALAEWNAVAAQ